MNWNPKLRLLFSGTRAFSFSLGWNPSPSFSVGEKENPVLTFVKASWKTTQPRNRFLPILLCYLFHHDSANRDAPTFPEPPATTAGQPILLRQHPFRRGGRWDHRRVRRCGLLLSMWAREPPRPRRLQGSGRPLPARAQEEAPPTHDQEGSSTAASPSLPLRLRWHGAPNPPDFRRCNRHRYFGKIKRIGTRGNGLRERNVGEVLQYWVLEKFFSKGVEVRNAFTIAFNLISFTAVVEVVGSMKLGGSF